MPIALVTGVTGQDGSYLSELLLSHAYRVVGVTRNASTGRHRLTTAGAPADGIELREASVTDAEALRRIVAEVVPDEIYNLAGQARIGPSWEDPVGTGDASGLGVARLLEAMRHHAPRARFFQAGTAEMFAADASAPQNEDSPFRPASPYGAAKLYAHHLTRAYRETHGLYAVSAILFNHESPRRSDAYVTRKITRAVARIARGEQRELTLGNLDARRDWGFAGDHMRAAWMMLQRDVPEDLVIGTGVAHSVGEFCEAAFAEAGLNWREFVVSTPSLHRSGDATLRVADPARARSRLGWTPEVDFQRLVTMMVRHDMQEEARIGERRAPTAVSRAPREG